MGNFEFRSIPTMERSDCGHDSGVPRGDDDQSRARINAPVSPPLFRNVSAGSEDVPMQSLPVKALKIDLGAVYRTRS
jgi:hypothetical protein